MWRVYKAAGRPWPVVCDDDVLDYMVMEAIAIKAGKEDEKTRKEEEKKAETEEWKSDKSELDQYR